LGKQHRRGENTEKKGVLGAKTHRRSEGKEGKKLHRGKKRDLGFRKRTKKTGGRKMKTLFRKAAGQQGPKNRAERRGKEGRSNA